MGKEAALLRPDPACWGQGDGLCATCRLGNVQHGLCCKTSQPHSAGQGQSGGFSALTQTTEGTGSTAVPTAGPQRRSPQQRWSQLRDWTPQAWEQVPLPDCRTARYSLHVPRQTWAFLAVGIDLGPARPPPPRTSCFSDPGGRGPGFVCVESAGSVRPGPAGTKGQERMREVDGWVETRRG